MRQLSLAETGFLPRVMKQTQKALILPEMEAVGPRSWALLIRTSDFF